MKSLIYIIFIVLISACGTDSDTICEFIGKGVAYQSNDLLYFETDGKYYHNSLHFSNGRYELKDTEHLLPGSISHKGSYSCVDGAVILSEDSIDETSDDTLKVTFNRSLDTVFVGRGILYNGSFHRINTDAQPICDDVNDRLYTDPQGSGAYIDFSILEEYQNIITYSWDGIDTQYAIYDCDLGKLHLHPINSIGEWQAYLNQQPSNPAIPSFGVEVTYKQFGQHSVSIDENQNSLTVLTDNGPLVLD